MVKEKNGKFKPPLAAIDDQARIPMERAYVKIRSLFSEDERKSGLPCNIDLRCPVQTTFSSAHHLAGA
jgi:hypothetical protein